MHLVQLCVQQRNDYQETISYMSSMQNTVIPLSVRKRTCARSFSRLTFFSTATNADPMLGGISVCNRIGYRSETTLETDDNMIRQMT